MEWHFRRFAELDAASLFALMKLRVDVFVVEQNCAYPELDEHDNAADTLHLLGLVDGRLAAYARAMPGSTLPVTEHATCDAALPAGAGDEHIVRIGRVVVDAGFRAEGLGRVLMQQMISHLERHHPDQNQFLAAQIVVQTFYESLGFRPVSTPYLEDGIPHIDMLRAPQP